MTADISFPRQHARTQGFSLGVPHAFAISPDGSRIAFLRSSSGTDRGTCLWLRDTATGTERLVVDPRQLLSGGEEDLPDEERARRERARQAAAGVVSFAADEAVTIAAFALSGRLFVADLTDEAENVTYGLAEFVAAEEMDRTRGFWWSPDGQQLLVARADTTPVNRWYLSDPAHPDRPPAEVAYPVAGTANADVSVVLAGLDGAVTPVAWDSAAMPYLTTVHWSPGGPALLQVVSRDQRTLRVLATEPVCEDTDPDWVDVVPGSPAWTPGGQLVRVRAHDGAYRLMIGDKPVTAPELNVREILDVDEDVLFTATEQDPAQQHVYAGGLGDAVRLTSEPGLHRAARRADVLVTSSRSLAWDGARDAGADARGDVPDRRSPSDQVRAAAAARAQAGLGPAAGALRSLRRPGRPARPVGAQRLPDLAVVR